MCNDRISFINLGRHRFHEHAAALNVSSSALYTALLADAEKQPPNWDLQGRQVNIWKKLGVTSDSIVRMPSLIPYQLGYIPSDVWEVGGTNTKQVSRTLEVSCFSSRCEWCRSKPISSMLSMTSPSHKSPRS